MPDPIFSGNSQTAQSCSHQYSVLPATAIAPINSEVVSAGHCACDTDRHSRSATKARCHTDNNAGLFCVVPFRSSGRTSQSVMAAVSKTVERTYVRLEGSIPSPSAFCNSQTCCVSDRAARYRVSIPARRVRLPRDTFPTHCGVVSAGRNPRL